jgi:hypothetical protein
VIRERIKLARGGGGEEEEEFFMRDDVTETENVWC